MKSRIISIVYKMSADGKHFTAVGIPFQCVAATGKASASVSTKATKVERPPSSNK